MKEEVRLQKFLADCGIASRRKAEEMIAAGAVRVNGKPVQVGDKVDPSQDKVSVHGRRVVAQKKMVYVMLHKPRGYVTTMSDEMGRKCVAELVENVGTRVYPVGRLDRESEGLLFLTNDGDFAQMMMHPSRHVGKTYRVTIRPDITEDQITTLVTGMSARARVSIPALRSFRSNNRVPASNSFAAFAESADAGSAQFAERNGHREWLRKF